MTTSRRSKTINLLYMTMSEMSMVSHVRYDSLLQSLQTLNGSAEQTTHKPFTKKLERILKL